MWGVVPILWLSCANFHSQLKQAEDSLKVENEEIDEVREEFTVRVAATEKKFQAAAKVCAVFMEHMYSVVQRVFV